MRATRRPRRFIAAIGGLGIALLAAQLTAFAPPSEAQAAWPWQGKPQHPACGHSCCGPDRCVAPAGWAGEWYWVRSPDQERCVVVGLYNRYCIRCHGGDGRGVCGIPDVPDFTDSRWQTSRPNPQIVNILMQGRGAVMPPFRATLTVEEAWAMARFLRTFGPSTEAARPGVSRSAPTQPAQGTLTPPAALPVAVRAVAPPR